MPFSLFRVWKQLPLRIREHVKNASAVADFLAAHPAVASVNYPRLQTGTAARRAHAYLKGGYGGLVGFELKGGFDAGQAFINALKLSTMSPILVMRVHWQYIRHRPHIRS